ncbi:hypothetical protein HDU92_007191 [Lobulomyces angularis]|nr:hypothetical protein HDU92_007191 [Lobulomyces angularis]
MQFEENILYQLQSRDLREFEPYLEIMSSYNQIVENLSLALKKNENNSLHSNDNNSELINLKTELTDLYKTHSSQSTQLFEYLTKTQDLEKSLETSHIQNKKLVENFQLQNKKIDELEEAIVQKNNIIMNLTDELNVYKLDLTVKEAKYNELEKKYRDTEKENQNLVDTILKLKEEQSSKLNEVNDFVESALKSKTPSSTSLTKEGTEMDRRKSNVRCYLPMGMVKKISPQGSETHCIAISKNGSLLAVGGQDKKLHMYDSNTGTLQKSLVGSLSGIMSVNFNSASDILLGASNDNSIKLWNLGTSRLIHSLTGHIGKVYSARFTDSNKVISGSHDRSIKIWDLSKGYCIKTVFTLSSCNDLTSLDSEGTVIVSGHLDSNVRFWDTRSGNTIKELTSLHSGQITSVEVFPNSYQLLTTSRDNTLKLIDARNYEVINTFSESSYRNGMNWLKSCFSPDGSYVISGGVDGTIFIWNTLTAKIEKIFKGIHRSSVCGVVWNPLGGNLLYSVEKDNCVVCWGTP